MRKLSKLAISGIAAVTIGGAAAAANPDKHVMDVPLPDGSTAHIESYGDVAPKVTVDPPAFGRFPRLGLPGAFPDLMNIDRMFEQMERRHGEMLRRMQRLPRNRIGRGPTANVAAYGDMPAGTSSISVVSTTNAGGTCTRTTEVTSQGAGKAPKVVTKVSGNCSEAQSTPTQPTGAINHT